MTAEEPSRGGCIAGACVLPGVIFGIIFIEPARALFPAHTSLALLVISFLLVSCGFLLIRVLRICALGGMSIGAAIGILIAAEPSIHFF